MSIDFLVCNNCGETFPDCGYVVGCYCGNYWCSDECANEDGYEKNDENELKDGDLECSCSFCRNEKFTDSELLIYAVEKFGITIEKLSEELLLANRGEIKC